MTITAAHVGVRFEETAEDPNPNANPNANPNLTLTLTLTEALARGLSSSAGRNGSRYTWNSNGSICSAGCRLGKREKDQILRQRLAESPWTHQLEVLRREMVRVTGNGTAPGLLGMTSRVKGGCRRNPLLFVTHSLCERTARI